MPHLTQALLAEGRKRDKEKKRKSRRREKERSSFLSETPGDTTGLPANNGPATAPNQASLPGETVFLLLGNLDFFFCW